MADGEVIRPGGEVCLPIVTIEDDAWIYPNGLTEGNLLAMQFAAQTLGDEELRRAFGPEVAQVFLDRGYGKDRLPPVPTTPEAQRAAVERALRLGLVRDQYGRPAAR